MRFRTYRTALSSLVLVLVLAASVVAQVPKRKVALRCGQLFDGRGDALVPNAVVLVDGERIIAVGRGVSVPPDAQTIDLSSLTCLPGLIDTHTHLFLHEGDYDSQVIRESQARRVIQAVAHARQTLEAGFTTLRDLETEGAGYADVDLRDAIARGTVPGPRIIASTLALAVTGGYFPRGYPPGRDLPFGAQVADGVDEVRKAVREQIKFGADWIKAYGDGYRRPPFGDPRQVMLEFSEEEMKAMVEEAANAGIRVAVHCYLSACAQRAVRAGAGSIEHGLFLDEPTLQLMKERGVYWVPTLTAYRSGLAQATTPEAKARFEISTRGHKETFQRALKVGTKIAFGSDATGPHGQQAEELVVMVEYGMTPLAALRSATSVAAELLKMQDAIGTLAPGRYADVIAVPGSPLQDIGILHDVRFVMKAGAVIKG